MDVDVLLKLENTAFLSNINNCHNINSMDNPTETIIKNVSHLSSNGYYGFSQICNNNNDKSLQIDQQHQMDVEMQPSSSSSKLNNIHQSSVIPISIDNPMTNYRNNFIARRKRFFNEENHNAKRFRSCGQEHVFGNFDNFSSSQFPLSSSSSSINNQQTVSTNNFIVEHDYTSSSKGITYPQIEVKSDHGNNSLKICNHQNANNDLLKNSTKNTNECNHDLSLKYYTKDNFNKYFMTSTLPISSITLSQLKHHHSQQLQSSSSSSFNKCNDTENNHNLSLLLNNEKVQNNKINKTNLEQDIINDNQNNLIDAVATFENLFWSLHGTSNYLINRLNCDDI